MLLPLSAAACGSIPACPEGRRPRLPRPPHPVSARHRSIAIMQLHVSDPALRLAANACPDPLDSTLSKRAWEVLCMDYRHRCRTATAALEFFEFFELEIIFARHDGPRLLALPSAHASSAALGSAAFLDSLD
jgi:hypothetical protein